MRLLHHHAFCGNRDFPGGPQSCREFAGYSSEKGPAWSQDAPINNSERPNPHESLCLEQGLFPGVLNPFLGTTQNAVTCRLRLSQKRRTRLFCCWRFRRPVGGWARLHRAAIGGYLLRAYENSPRGNGRNSSTPFAARSPVSQAPATVPQRDSCTASPANQIRSLNG